jgi:GNAT superfamily N-acetyltransferase
VIEVTVRELRRDELPAAVGVVARGMRDNPMHVAVFGNDPARRLRRLDAMFRAYLSAMRHLPLGAYRSGSGTLVGVLGLESPEACRPSIAGGLRVVASVYAAGPVVALRATRWFAAYERRDPDERHWHLGPVAVDAGLQGMGIGSQMMASFRALVDAARDMAYLETDKPENVKFYARFGFETIAETTILGAQNWFMRRPPPSP